MGTQLMWVSGRLRATRGRRPTGTSPARLEQARLFRRQGVYARTHHSRADAESGTISRSNSWCRHRATTATSPYGARPASGRPRPGARLSSATSSITSCTLCPIELRGLCQQGHGRRGLNRARPLVGLARRLQIALAGQPVTQGEPDCFRRV